MKDELMLEIPVLEIMDTTLRDGEQMKNVSYTVEEKLTISKMLLTEVRVDRLEITSARVSQGEKETVTKIVAWAREANLLNRLEILGFVDHTQSVDWAKAVGIQRINLLTKGSLKHCSEQLHKTLKQHQHDIRETIEYAASQQVEINVYLEDFSNGIKHSPEYVHDLISFLLTLPVKRILLPDTLGVFNPFETYQHVADIVKRYPQAHFEFHPHNDYGLGVANALAAVKAGARGIHVTVNGMGERAGNAALDEVAVCLKDFLGIPLNIDETKLHLVSQYVEMFSGQRMAPNKPIYGKNVFTQTAGIHADGDKKGKLYVNRLMPERFGRRTEYALGKLSGKANLEMCLKDLGIELADDEKKVLLSKIIELGDKKEVITTEDLPYLISDIFETPQDSAFKLVRCVITSAYHMHPIAAIKCAYDGKEVDGYGHGSGGYDAFMRALKSVLKEFSLQIPQLIDYVVTIPPGGKTDSLVQATISWQVKRHGKAITVTTRGVNSDQNMAAIDATVKVINLIVAHHHH